MYFAYIVFIHLYVFIYPSKHWPQCTDGGQRITSSGVGTLLPRYGRQRLNSGHHITHQMPFPILSSPQLRGVVNNSLHYPDYFKSLYRIMAKEKYPKVTIKWHVKYHMCILYTHGYKLVCTHCLKLFFV